MSPSQAASLDVVSTPLLFFLQMERFVFIKAEGLWCSTYSYSTPDAAHHA